MTVPAAMPARYPPPLSGLPLAPLLERADELAQRWAVALILARPLAAIGELALEDLALEAPALCRLLLRALESDGALEELAEPGSASARLAELAGARDGGELVVAVEALRGVLWEALVLELGSRMGEGRRAADAGDRLAFACASMLVAALGGRAAESDERADGAPAPGPARARGDAVIVDEQRFGGQAEARAAEQPVPLRPRARAADTMAGDGGVEIAARDQRGEDGAAAWSGVVGRELARFERDRMPFALLLLEAPAVARMAGEGLSEGAALAARVEQALAAELSAAEHGGRPASAAAAEALTRERAGRYWLVARGLDRGAAELLAERLTRAVAWAGEEGSLELVAGVAVCPEDGCEAAGLAAHADIELYAARRAR